VTLGDSKSARREWQQILVNSIGSAGHTEFDWADAAHSGSTVAEAANPADPSYVNKLINELLPFQDLPISNFDIVSHVLLNWGANDMEQGATEISFKTNYLSIIDLAHTRFPNAKIYIMYPWRGSFDSQSATMHTWIDDIISQRSSFTFAGPDEAIWFKNSGPDSGDAGMVHYSVPLGATLAAEAWKTALGF
jgi:hypothetical protein